jgi:hypothetical protein
VNAGSEALRTSLGTPQSTGSQRRETHSQGVLGVSWHHWPAADEVDDHPLRPTEVFSCELPKPITEDGERIPNLFLAEP